MVQDLIAKQGGQRFGVVTRVARQLGIGTEPCAAGYSRPMSTRADGGHVDGGQFADS